MLVRDITYEDFNGETVTDKYYFNLTRTEIVDLQLSYDGGLETAIQAIVKAEDIKALITEFKKIVLMAYGVRSDDGKRFIKSDQLREEFTQTAAYDALFVELTTNETAAADFIKGVIPRDIQQEFDKQEKAEVVNLPPPPPKVS